MQVFERDNALKMNFKPKKVTEKADIEIKADEQGNPVIDVGDGTISGGGLPEGGNEGDTIVRTKVEGGIFGHAPDFESGTIGKMYLNIRDLKYANFDGYPEMLYSAFVNDTEYEEPITASIEAFEGIVFASLKVSIDEYGTVIVVNTTDFPNTDKDIELDAHSAYKITVTEEGVSAEKIENDIYILSQNEYYGTVYEDDGVDFNDVIHYISFEEPFDEVEEEIGAEWRPLPILGVEFTPVEGEGDTFVCNVPYAKIIDAYTEGGSAVTGIVSNFEGGRLTVIAESYDAGEQHEFKMCPIGWSLPFSYLYYDEVSNYWYAYAQE